MTRDPSRVTVVLWHGQYCNDGLEILAKHDRTLFGLHGPRLVGRAGNWRLVADVSLYEPHISDRRAS